MRIFSNYLAVALLAGTMLASDAYAQSSAIYNRVGADGQSLVRTDPEPQASADAVDGGEIVVTAPRTAAQQRALDAKKSETHESAHTASSPATDTPPATVASNGAANLNPQTPMAAPSAEDLQAAATAMTSIANALGAGINTRDAANVVNAIAGLLAGDMSPQEAQSAAATAVNSPNNPANTVAAAGLASMGIIDTEECRKIGATVGAIRDEGNERTNTEVKAVASLPPTSTLACDQMAAVNITNTIIDMTRSSGAPVQILQAVMQGSAGFTQNLSVSVDVANVVSGVLNNGWRGAVGALISGIGGGGRISPNSVGCRDSLSKINAAMSCLTRVMGGGSASSVSGACLNPQTIAAVTGGNLFKKDGEAAAAAASATHESAHAGASNSSSSGSGSGERYYTLMNGRNVEYNNTAEVRAAKAEMDRLGEIMSRVGTDPNSSSEEKQRAWDNRQEAVRRYNEILQRNLVSGSGG